MYGFSRICQEHLFVLSSMPSLPFSMQWQAIENHQTTIHPARYNTHTDCVERLQQCPHDDLYRPTIIDIKSIQLNKQKGEILTIPFSNGNQGQEYLEIVFFRQPPHPLQLS